ncbi:hypothetical protein MTR_2g014810 [Medicago truncatula]|uniref:Uncharacterized protein n=1 Tax=Medicago truncatula TaxID=3880 RepID=G7IFG6_MEDTR|nr:hypothetical protein MTR_2g014810 [Medicago truncatula]
MATQIYVTIGQVRGCSSTYIIRLLRSLRLRMAIGPRLDGYPQKIPTMGRVKPRFHGYGESAGNGWGYEHLSAHRVWGRALKLLPTRVRARVRTFFTNEGMGIDTIVPYPLGTHCHP